MKINWESVKYLFQIPLEWFKSVSDRVFKAYGTNFIVVRDGEDGAMHIDVDEDNFNAAVGAAIDLSSLGAVKTVDGIAPDLSGNVELSCVKKVNRKSPDLSGNVDVGTVTSVNGVFPDAQGWVWLGTILSGVDNVTQNDFGMLHLNAVRSVNGITTDSEHGYNVNLSGLVETVNDIAPDENGNVDLGDLVKTVDGISPDANGDIDFNLAASKWMKTDANGHIWTTDETPIAIDSQQYTPLTTTLTCVNEVQWNGTALTKMASILTFVNGVLVGATNPSATNIDVPVVITWS